MTSDDLITLAARGLARAVRDYVIEVGPAAVAAGTGLALTLAGASLLLTLAAAAAALLLSGRLLWTRSRLASAASDRAGRRAARRVLDNWPAAAVAGRLVTHDDHVPSVTLIEPVPTVTGSLLNLHLRLPPGLTGEDVELAAGRLAVAFGAARVEVEADPHAAARVVARIVMDDPLATPAAERSPLLDARAPWHPNSCAPSADSATAACSHPNCWVSTGWWRG